VLKEEATPVLGGFLAVPLSRSNWNLEKLVFGRSAQENWSTRNKSLGGQVRQEPTPNSTQTQPKHGTGVLSQGSKLTTNWSHMQQDFWFCA